MKRSPLSPRPCLDPANGFPESPRTRPSVRNGGGVRGARARAGSFALVALLALGLTHCASPPAGPAFRLAPNPPAHRGRVYVYRMDERRSLTQVNVKLGGRTLATLRDREYQTLELGRGEHELGAQMRGLGLVPLGWNAHRFKVEAGDTVYLHLSVRVEATKGAPPSLAIGGRSNDVLKENVYILERGPEEAERDLRLTTLGAGGE